MLKPAESGPAVQRLVGRSHLGFQGAARSAVRILKGLPLALAPSSLVKDGICRPNSLSLLAAPL